jgi:uncharacterized membrane protein
MGTNSQASTDPTAPALKQGGIAIQDAASWVLRIGVVVSVTVMVAGLALAFVKGGLTQAVMESRPFSSEFAALARGIAAGDPFALIELGVLLLVLTPILRVFSAMVLFATEERDRLYTAVTFLVLVMTVGSLLLIK